MANPLLETATWRQVQEDGDHDMLEAKHLQGIEVKAEWEERRNKA